MKKVYNFLEKMTSGIFFVQKIVLVILSVGIVGITITDIILRLTVKTGITWAQESCIAIFMSLIFLGANIAMKTNGEIKIDLLHFNNEKAELIYQTILDIICLCIIAFLFRSAFASVKNAVAKPQKLATIPLTYATLYTVMPIGFALMFIDKFVAMLRRFFNRELNEQLIKEADEMQNTDK